MNDRASVFVRSFLVGVTFLVVIPGARLDRIARGQDASLELEPLASWRDGAAKAAILSFVEAVTQQDEPTYVAPENRIAVFDNDGTLWCEYPVPNQAAFAVDEVNRLLPEHPKWRTEAAVQALLGGDLAALKADHYRGLLQVIAMTHAGMTNLEFHDRVQQWLARARHPRFGVAYAQTIYQPMLELLVYLRQHGFETWIVSGGGQDFMRVFAEETYGIPPQQVIGSHARMKYELRDGQPTLIKTMDQLFVDDKEGKPAAIAQFIGRRPIACFGNSDGDQAMLEYVTINNPLPSFGMLIHHTDADREYAYDKDPPGSGRLETALPAAETHGWTVVDMQRDWKTVFSK